MTSLTKKIFFLVSFSVAISFGQPFLREIEPFPVTKSGVPIAQPFAGGINTPLIEFADIDSDGDADLFIFDDDFSTTLYRNEGTSSVPEFKVRSRLIDVPSFLFWFKVVDFNGDGKFDFLCDDSSNGISFYRNDGTRQSPSFTLAEKTLRDADSNIVFAGVLGKPDFTDIDGDNDLDFFSSNFNGTVNFYENIGTSQLPRLAFRTAEFQNFAILNDSCIPWSQFVPKNLHGGSNFFFADIDGNGTKDMFIGDLNSAGIFYLQNNGTPTSPMLVCTHNRYPPENPIQTSGFNVPYLLDIDGDSDLDMFNGVMLDIQRNGFWYLENVGSSSDAVFELRTKNFLSMLDVGKNAHPVFTDIDNDGDKDLFIGNLNGGISFFRNGGSPTNPSFVFVDSVFGGVTGNFSYAPAFADIDNDGDEDLFVGRFDGRIKFYRNDGTPASANFISAASPIDTINVAMNAAPSFVDIDGDGDFDLFVGRANGSIRYYRNNGNAELFVPVLADASFNSINVTENSKPIFSDYDADGDYDLFVGNIGGKIFWWKNTGTASAPLFEFQNDAFGDIDPLRESAPAFCDIDDDGDSDLFVGTSKGGIQFYRNQRIQSNVEEEAFPRHVQLFQNYPNPFNPITEIRYRTSEVGVVILKVYTMLGKEIAVLVNEIQSPGEKSVVWNANEFPSGVYYYSLFTGSNLSVRKMVLIK